MRQLICNRLSPLVLCIMAIPTFAQDMPPAAPRPRPAAPAAPFDPRNYEPVCSTEKVNGNCVFNIDRKYPITMPTFQLRRGSHVTVYVFNPLSFEVLTLDPGTAQAFEGNDQASALVTAAIPVAKGAVFGLFDSDQANAALSTNAGFMATMDIMSSRLNSAATPPPYVALANTILNELNDLDTILTQAIVPLRNYFKETKEIYAAVREIESSPPRPQNLDGGLLRGPKIDPNTPDPWENYADWRAFMSNKITRQGNDTTAVLDRLPQPCQKSTDAAPAVGPWLPPARPCKATNPNGGVQNPDNPFAIPATYDTEYSALQQNLALLPTGQPDQETFKQIQISKARLDARKLLIIQAIPDLQALITRVSPDMQTILANVNAVRERPQNPTLLGVIPPPPYPNNPTPEQKVLAPYRALAPQMTYTVNSQNEIANSLLSLPAATQKQAIATITVLYASPRFEGSAGAFFSFMPNRTFANYTDATVTGGVPAPTDIRIDMTETTPPLVIPFVAANYRISPEFTWLGKRRGALYATAGVALNPYNTQVEYAAGLSLSWRFLIFGPLLHVGHATHLTQGEQVGQVWCEYGAPTGASPPACGSPSAPSTKMFWRGAFAFGIAVRVPTTYSSTNH